MCKSKSIKELFSLTDLMIMLSCSHLGAMLLGWKIVLFTLSGMSFFRNYQMFR